MQKEEVNTLSQSLFEELKERLKGKGVEIILIIKNEPDDKTKLLGCATDIHPVELLEVLDKVELGVMKAILKNSGPEVELTTHGPKAES